MKMNEDIKRREYDKNQDFINFSQFSTEEPGSDCGSDPGSDRGSDPGLQKHSSIFT